MSIENQKLSKNREEHINNYHSGSDQYKDWEKYCYIELTVEFTVEVYKLAEE